MSIHTVCFPMLPRALLGSLLLALAQACASPPRPPMDARSAAAATPELDRRAAAAEQLERVALLGASVTDGFGLALELSGEQRSLADFLAAAERSADPGARQRLDLADHLLFLQAEPAARTQIEATAKFQPTLVLAPDLLFWFVYGDRREEQRLAAFERGLALIDGLRARLSAPLVLGDLPDMSSASELMLPKSLRPSAATLEAANRRATAWAREREDVVLVPLADLALALDDDGALSGPGWSFEPGESDELLQADQLHPTVLGTALLLNLCFETLAERQARLSLRQAPRAGSGDDANRQGELAAERAAWRAAYASLLELDPHRLAERVQSEAQAARLADPR
jgi:hypothetical protein